MQEVAAILSKCVTYLFQLYTPNYAKHKIIFVLASPNPWQPHCNGDPLGDISQSLPSLPTLLPSLESIHTIVCRKRLKMYTVSSSVDLTFSRRSMDFLAGWRWDDLTPTYTWSCCYGTLYIRSMAHIAHTGTCPVHVALSAGILPIRSSIRGKHPYLKLRVFMHHVIEISSSSLARQPLPSALLLLRNHGDCVIAVNVEGRGWCARLIK